MRGLLLFTVFFSLLPLIFARGPFYGILMWFWLSLMNPQLVIWDNIFASIPYDLLVALATFLSLALSSREPKLPPVDKTTVLLVILATWITITSLLGIAEPAIIYQKWNMTEKMLLMTLVAYTLTTTRQRIDQLIIVCAFSIAFWGIKGGLWSLLLSGGGARVYGPNGSMFGDNNDLGFVLTFMMPLLFYIRSRCTRPELRWLMLALIGLTFLGDVFTYSRGALVALLAMGAMLWWRSQQKILMTGIMIVAALAVVDFAPPEWFERMDTISNYQQDGSAEGRILMWTRAWALVERHPITGGGFHWSYDPAAANYALAGSGLPPFEKPRAPHSIWFEMLGDQGFVGLAIFIAILASMAVDARWLVRRTRGNPDLAWANNLGRMMQVSLIAYCAAGTFLTQAMYDGFYALVIITAATRRVVAAELRSRDAVADSQRPLIVSPAPRELHPQPSG